MDYYNIRKLRRIIFKGGENINNKIIDIECLHNISIRHDVENLKEQIDKLRISYIASKKNMRI